MVVVVKVVIFWCVLSFLLLVDGHFLDSERHFNALYYYYNYFYYYCHYYYCHYYYCHYYCH